jgi:hypothetical protein
MALLHSNFQLEDKVKKIQRMLATEVPTYLSATAGNSIDNCHKYHKSDFKVLNCSVKLLDQFKLGFHAASVMYEAEINLEDSEGQNVHYVIVKTMPTSALLRSVMNSTDQFFNESKMYSEMVPLLFEACAAPSCEYVKTGMSPSNLEAAYDLFPKCYYVSSHPEYGMVVLKDLRYSGYKIGGDDVMLLDYEHIAVALKGLARFHAMSYAIKRKDFRSFKENVVTQIRDARHFLKRSDAVDDSTDVDYAKALRYTALLLLGKYEEKQLEEGGLHIEKVRKVLERIENSSELMIELLSPDEPLAVLCHGDFNRNNMLFCYDSENKPSAVNFFDFQNPYFASPAIDLSFFLFVNASPDLWANCFDDMFSIYHGTLLEAVSEFLNCPQEALHPEFSLEAFKNQFSKYCLYGFMVATSFILGQSVDPNSVKAFDVFVDSAPTAEEMDNYVKASVEFAKDKVMDRVLSLTQEMLNKISL